MFALETLSLHCTCSSVRSAGPGVLFDVVADFVGFGADVVVLFGVLEAVFLADGAVAVEDELADVFAGGGAVVVA